MLPASLNAGSVMPRRRKIHLYSRREYGALFRRFLLHPRRTKRDRAACGLWYDGRR